MLGLPLTLIESKDDRKKYNEFYYEYKDYLYKLSFAILHNNAQAEEVVSETFFKVAMNFDKIKNEPGPKVRSYFVILCRNISINIYKQNKREHADDIFDIADAVNQAADVNFFERFDTQLVVEKLRLLPEIYCDVLYFEIIWEYSVEEIAVLLNITVSAAYKRIQRAKKMMREMLEKEGEACE